jgi:hypothetical protein
VQTLDLDDFRGSIGSLHVDGSHVGYLATVVEPMRTGILLRGHERVWLLLTRLDGTLDIQEDYAPWTYVPELQNGHIKWSPTRDGEEVDYQVRWLTGDDRRNAWLRYGIVGNVGTYIARAARG